VSAFSWVADELLGSPIPPPRWLDPRHGRDGWSAPPAGYFSGPMHVSGGYIQAELEALYSCVNPPVVQGWAWILALLGGASVFAGFVSLRHDGAGDPRAMVLVLAPLPLWFAAVVIGAFFAHDVELREGSVCVRRWTDVWFGRPGRLVGSRASVHAVLSCGSHVHLEGDGQVVVVSMAMWPGSSRQAIEERLERWGIELEFPGHHHPHHPQHWNHGRHRVAHPLPVQGRHKPAGGLTAPLDRE
jgi:hypothetical protein